MTNDGDLQLIRAAYAVARAARERGNHPFGALLADARGSLLLSAENTVVTERDCTGHAETNLVRLASARFSAAELAACTLYTSTEPCAMCAAAIHWGSIGRVVFGLSSAAFYAMLGPSPDQLALSCREVFARSRRPIEVIGPVLEEEGLQVHAGFWSS
jgi:tRNA(Arg) A34 adenosine deaminase TadA